MGAFPNASIAVSIEYDDDFYLWNSDNYYNRIDVGNYIENKWAHFAISRHDDTIELYINGMFINQSTGTAAIDFSDSSNNLTIGNEPTGDNPYKGLIAGFRITKDRVYFGTSGQCFTPPVYPLTDLSGTTLLINPTDWPSFRDETDLNDISNSLVWVSDLTPILI
jgi:hypothetical protein